MGAAVGELWVRYGSYAHRDGHSQGSAADTLWVVYGRRSFHDRHVGPCSVWCCGAGLGVGQVPGSEENHQRYLVGDAGSGSVAYSRRLGRRALVICRTEPNHLSRQPPRFLFVAAVGASLLPGFVGALSPAAAAQFRVEEVCATSGFMWVE